jgi:hypothetical protein
VMEVRKTGAVAYRKGHGCRERRMHVGPDN